MNYNDYILIPSNNESIFESERKHELSQLEMIGLKKVLGDFIREYELNTDGTVYSTDIDDYIVINGDGAEIMDGEADTYIFEHYAIGKIWTTNGGCIMMTAYDLEQYNGDDMERFEESELFERVRLFDIRGEFESVLFRLD